MAVTLPAIMKELKKADPSAQVAMFVDRRIVPIHEIVRVPGTPYVFLVEKPRDLMRRSFTESEIGFICFAASTGIPDESVARLLGRTERSIAQQRKKSGI